MGEKARQFRRRALVLYQYFPGTCLPVTPIKSYISTIAVVSRLDWVLFNVINQFHSTTLQLTINNLTICKGVNFISSQFTSNIGKRRVRFPSSSAMADIQMAAATGGQFPEFPAVFSHGGQFIQYNIFGNLFEVTAKYRPPIMPIGRGAYGIVW